MCDQPQGLVSRAARSSYGHDNAVGASLRFPQVMQVDVEGTYTGDGEATAAGEWGDLVLW